MLIITISAANCYILELKCRFWGFILCYGVLLFKVSIKISPQMLADITVVHSHTTHSWEANFGFGCDLREIRVEIVPFCLKSFPTQCSGWIMTKIA